MGDDAHGDYLAEVVLALGVTLRIGRAAGPTGVMFKATGPKGDPEVLQVRGRTAYARSATTMIDDGLLSLIGVDHLHLTGIGLGLSAAARNTIDSTLHAAVNGLFADEGVEVGASMTG